METRHKLCLKTAMTWSITLPPLCAPLRRTPPPHPRSLLHFIVAPGDPLHSAAVPLGPRLSTDPGPLFLSPSTAFGTASPAVTAPQARC